MAFRSTFGMISLAIAGICMLPASGQAVTINATLVQQSRCLPSTITSPCTGTVTVNFSNIPAGGGTVYAQAIRDTYTKLKCINVREPLPANRTFSVSLSPGVATAQIKISSQVGLSLGNGVTCTQGPVVGVTISSPTLTFTR